MSNTKIKKNSAEESGGGCYFSDKDITISGTLTEISENTAKIVMKDGDVGNFHYNKIKEYNV